MKRWNITRLVLLSMLVCLTNAVALSNDMGQLYVIPATIMLLFVSMRALLSLVLASFYFTHGDLDTIKEMQSEESLERMNYSVTEYLIVFIAAITTTGILYQYGMNYMYIWGIIATAFMLCGIVFEKKVSFPS